MEDKPNRTRPARQAGKRPGRYYEPMPIDFMILGTLPEEGTLGGVHWKGRQAKDIVTELTNNGVEGIDVTLVVSRLKSMYAGGHVKIFPSRNAHIWAKTKTGVSLQDKEEEYLNG